jgi:DsbC/DsbD-like thiol-disulfide interchange protein
MSKPLNLAIVLSLSFLTATAFSQTPADIVKWSSTIPSTSDAIVPVTISAQIELGWHVYGPTQEAGGPTAMTFRIPEGKPYSIAGAPKSAPPIKKRDENFQMETVFYERSARFTLPVKRAAGAQKDSVPVDVRFQVCNASLCLPPTTVHLTAEVAKPH